MAPHATSPSHSNGILTNGHTIADYEPTQSTGSGIRRSMLPETDPEELHDLICVGFGPASLAIAAALHDSFEFRRDDLPGLNDRLPKVAFLERQEHFAWHAGMQLAGAKMQISWLKDLATFRNPRSQFTFLNYLFSVGRLTDFSNVGTFLPLRVEYEAYMKWCADWFKHLAAYSQECLEVAPYRNKSQAEVQSFVVTTRNLKTQQVETRRARNVVISVGGRAILPKHLPQSHPRVIHSSSYTRKIPEILPERDAPYRVAVIGAGQSAAEIFHDLQSRYPNSRASLLIRGGALKPSDDSPFVNETFNPDHVDDLYEEAPDVRAADIQKDKATNYGVVRLELLEELYRDLYEQKVRHPDPADWQHAILPYREVVSVEDVPGSKRVRARVANKSGLHSKTQSPETEDRMDFDAVIVGAGYQRNLHEDLLANARDLMPNDGADGESWTVNRDYSVKFKTGSVANGAGVYLQGCNEGTHGLSDTLLSILGVRGKEVVDSIFGT